MATVASLATARVSFAQCIRAPLDVQWRDKAAAVFRGQVIGKDTVLTEGARAHVVVRVRVDTVWRFPESDRPSAGSAAHRAVPWVARGVVGLRAIEEGGTTDSCFPESPVGRSVLVYAFQDPAGAWSAAPGLGLLDLRFLDEFEYIRAERARLGPGRPWAP